MFALPERVTQLGKAQKDVTMKTYRSRNLCTRCQVAKDDGTGNPQRDDRGNAVLDHGGLWFYKISGTDANDNKRVVPQDHQAFFALKAKEIEDALKAEGVSDVTVTGEEVYAEYAATYTKPNRTFAPPGQPEEFSVVLPKELCVNWQGGGGTGARGLGRTAIVAPQATGLFARLRAAKTQANGNGVPTTIRKVKASA